MDALNLLKFWRNSGNEIILDVNADCKNKNDDDASFQASADGETDDDSFFELLFAPPDGYENYSEKKVKGGFNLVDSNKDVFRNKKVFPVDANVSKPQSPIALLKSAPRFRVFMLGFNKSKVEKTEVTGSLTATPRPKTFQNRKCRDEHVPAVSPLTPDHSLRTKLRSEGVNELSIEKASSKRFEKLIKPLYERASKRYGEKTRLSDQLSTSSPMSSPATAAFSSPRKALEVKPANKATGFKVMYKHLGKSRSTSSTAAMSSYPVSRRDDSLLLQHDGIQSAILHCKRSYNSANECSALWRCSSDASREKAVNEPRNFIIEQKRCSI